MPGCWYFTGFVHQFHGTYLYRHRMFLFLLFGCTGPYTIILGSPAHIEDVIQYADFTKRVSPVRLADQSTVDEEPDVEELSGLMDGSIQLNDSDLHVLPSGEFFSVQPPAGSRNGPMVRALASHQCGPGSIPGLQ